MALILNIETSSAVCSVCLANDGELLSITEDTAYNSHARMLTVLMELCCVDGKVAIEQVDAVAVSAGPGSFTGLRIGVSAAKGICYALGKPLIAVPTLYAVRNEMLQHRTAQTSYCLATLVSKRNEMYYALFDVSGEQLIATSFAEVNTSFEKLLPKNGIVCVGGSAVDLCKSVFTETRFEFFPCPSLSSSAMIQIAEKKFRHSQFEDIAYFEPMYFHDFLPKLPKK